MGFFQMKFENYGVFKKIMGFFANEIRKLWGFGKNYGVFSKWKKIMGFLPNEKLKNRSTASRTKARDLKLCFLKTRFFWIFSGWNWKMAIFPNENRKLWGFHLQKPHNLNFEIFENYGVFPNENPIIFHFHLEKFEILKKFGNYGVFSKWNRIFQMKKPHNPISFGKNPIICQKLANFWAKKVRFLHFFNSYQNVSFLWARKNSLQGTCVEFSEFSKYV